MNVKIKKDFIKGIFNHIYQIQILSSLLIFHTNKHFSAALFSLLDDAVILIDTAHISWSRISAALKIRFYHQQN